MKDILFLGQSRNIYNVFFSYLNMAELPQQTNPAGGQQGVAQPTSSFQQTTAASPGAQQSQDQGAKKSKGWIWILVGILVFIGIIVGAYFLFF